VKLSTPCLICGRLTRSGPRCRAHTLSTWPKSNDYGSDWRRVRDAYIAQHRMCEWPGCLRLADEVDHVISIRKDPSRRLDPSNLRSLCLHHHRGVTARASNRKGR
jgi:5-methylcytosine-specific restriction enzyme A